MTDLAREIAELLPCSGSSPQCDAHDPARCTPCRERPAILAWVQRKLDEAGAERVGDCNTCGAELGWLRMPSGGHSLCCPTCEIKAARADLDEAKADSELLAKVGWLLPRRGQIEIRLDVDGDWYARSVLIEHPASVRHGGGAPTLVEALRKLVESDS